MRLRPELRGEEDEVRELGRREAKRVLSELDIRAPRSGFDVNKGWLPAVERALRKMVDLGWDRDLHQVKEKFCGLRIYIGVGLYDEVDNLAKRLFRWPVQALAQNQKIWPKFRKAGLGSFVYRVFSKIRGALWDLTRSPLLCAQKESMISEAIREAEIECDSLCEWCGQERRLKGMGWGMALCDACGTEEERR